MCSEAWWEDLPEQWKNLAPLVRFMVSGAITAATEWYLTLENRRDVIERPLDGDLDISGWDIRKALNLFRRSNPPLLEWLQSPIVYGHVPGFAERLQALMGTYYAPCSCMHHYLHMARGNFREYLKGTTKGQVFRYVQITTGMRQWKHGTRADR